MQPQKHIIQVNFSIVDRSTHDWAFQSDSTNARVHRILAGVEDPKRVWEEFWQRLRDWLSGFWSRG